MRPGFGSVAISTSDNGLPNVDPSWATVDPRVYPLAKIDSALLHFVEIAAGITPSSNGVAIGLSLYVADARMVVDLVV
jgi:hypothetical protein